MNEIYTTLISLRNRIGRKGQIISFGCLLIGLIPMFYTIWNPVELKTDEEEGTFLIYRRQSLIGEESFSISKQGNETVVWSLQGENERGRISGIQAILRLNEDLTPVFYENKRISNSDTVTQLKIFSKDQLLSVQEINQQELNTQIPELFFPVHSNIPAAIELMLYQYYFEKGKPKNIKTFPRGEVNIRQSGTDSIQLDGKMEILKRFVVEGINWGGRTVWLNQSNELVAIVKANTQIREVIRKGYEHALPVFVKGNIKEQMAALKQYTISNKSELPKYTALVGGDLVDGLKDTTMRNMTILIEKDKIAQIGKQSDVEIPKEARIIDVTGKTLIPGLWDMHAHSNQVQWAPAYLAGGITTIRDNGNELEFATAFRDEIQKNGALGPDILLAGMVDGAGIKGNGIIRARSVQEGLEVVDKYYKNGYHQIKIYNSIEPEILEAICTAAHKLGLTVTGHVPLKVGNAVTAVKMGMDQFSHSGLFLSVLFPNETIDDIGRDFMNNMEVSQEKIDSSIDFFLRHKTVLDPTIGLKVIRAIPKGKAIETVEPDAHRIAYELWEGKRFRTGLTLKRSEEAKRGYTKEMAIIGQYYRAGIPIVAGTDNVVPVFSLYLEMETYHKLGDLSPFEALRTATIIPATVMGLNDVTGTLEIGKEADIAILDQNPLTNIENIRTVSAVLTNGNYFESNPLWIEADFKPKD